MGKSLKWLLRIVIGLVVLIALVVGGLWAYSQLAVRPAPEQPVAASTENTPVYQALAAGGIDEAMVDVTPERALVRYNLPSGMAEEVSWAYALAVLSAMAPGSGQAVIQVYQDFTPRTELTVALSDVSARLAGRLSPEDFEARLSIKRSPQ